MGAPTLNPELSSATRRRLATSLVPRRPCGLDLTPPPHPKQQAYLLADCRDLLFGGAAGGAKTSAAIMGALQYVCVPGYAAAIFGKTSVWLWGDKGPIRLSQDWLGGKPGVEWNKQDKIFTFPSGATLRFGYMQYDEDRYTYQGHAFQYAGFEELTQWATAKCYQYVGFSRVRKDSLRCAGCQRPLKHLGGDEYRHLGPTDVADLQAIDPDAYEDFLAKTPCSRPRWRADLDVCPSCKLSVAHVPLRTRATANPGGPGHAWVKARYNIRRELGRTIGGQGERRFIFSVIGDNPSLDRASYVMGGLSELNAVEREQLMKGDWEIREEGRFFQRAWVLGEAA